MDPQPKPYVLDPSSLEPVFYVAKAGGGICGSCRRIALFFVNRDGATVCAVCDEARGGK